MKGRVIRHDASAKCMPHVPPADQKFEAYDHLRLREQNQNQNQIEVTHCGASIRIDKINTDGLFAEK
ncbi:hypothetical protein [Paenibacillus sp. SSG-1]|uniref:hypothetical protein n=1 Tax=Paenibacillus sp. SSG-1 TaxID=1443669 RepID=UPI001C52D941|nr:hypothetical protein [Paenibacillus sp. SSG-1]